jgi:hypothetical protein
MKTSGKIILGILALLIVFIIGYKYHQFFLGMNYLMVAAVNCDPETEECFQYNCILDGDEEYWCDDTGSLLFYDGTPYKKLKVMGYDAPECLEAMTCLDLTCEDIDGECETVYCSEETVNVDTADGDEYCSSDGPPEWIDEE